MDRRWLPAKFASNRAATSLSSTLPKPMRPAGVSTSTSGSRYSRPACRCVLNQSRCRAEPLPFGWRRRRRPRPGPARPNRWERRYACSCCFSFGAARLRQQTVKTGRCHLGVDPISDHHGGRRGALAQAIDGLQRERAAGAVQAAAERLLRVGQQGVAAHALAGFGAADLYRAAGRRAALEVVIKGDHPVHLGTRQIETLGDAGHGGGRNEAEAVLDGVQGGQQLVLGQQAVVGKLVEQGGDMVVWGHGGGVLAYVL